MTLSVVSNVLQEPRQCRIFPQQQLTRFGFDVEILYIARKAEYVIL